MHSKRKRMQPKRSAETAAELQKRNNIEKATHFDASTINQFDITLNYPIFLQNIENAIMRL